ncbi:MAG: hypothetical protein M1826_006637 [Phylliscum demangeonii]|nr:MAG: hypothetical protein M1826_006637 [Phylliscum demangeonii]
MAPVALPSSPAPPPAPAPSTTVAPPGTELCSGPSKPFKPSGELITQGAEALVYKTSYLLPTIACALKYRPPKRYRHPVLDARLTRHRLLAEARVLVRCRREGVRVPAVYFVDGDAGCLMMEWIHGRTVRDVLRACLPDETTTTTTEEPPPPAHAAHGEAATLALATPDVDVDVDVRALMRQVGRAVGMMHAIGVVHGDLTTSNLMLAPVAPDASTATTLLAGAGWLPSSSTTTTIPPPSVAGEIILIDFGLAAQSVQEEDRAVDLYVLERAFGSTHPRAEVLFGLVLEAYGESFAGARAALRRLDEVRSRGRKKSMLG